MTALDLAPDPDDTVRLVRSHRADVGRRLRWRPAEVSIALVVGGTLVLLAAVCGLCGLGVLRTLV